MRNDAGCKLEKEVSHLKGQNENLGVIFGVMALHSYIPRLIYSFPCISTVSLVSHPPPGLLDHLYYLLHRGITQSPRKNSKSKVPEPETGNHLGHL